MSHILISFNGFWLLLMLFEIDHKIGVFQESKVWSKNMVFSLYGHWLIIAFVWIHINPKFNIVGVHFKLYLSILSCMLFKNTFNPEIVRQSVLVTKWYLMDLVIIAKNTEQNSIYLYGNGKIKNKHTLTILYTCTTTERQIAACLIEWKPVLILFSFRKRFSEILS